ncbi:hypothetical protein [Salegentibacter sp. UBA1130]|uniref:hypothetical protein n=1 Tax=Salegentibacter sp. UBA1130 TaxID=1947451 RepID=UPI00257D5334|nr:hypothetical protein [Salegentibacter sp. UBA1130]
MENVLLILDTNCTFDIWEVILAILVAALPTFILYKGQKNLAAKQRDFISNVVEGKIIDSYLKGNQAKLESHYNLRYAKIITKILENPIQKLEILYLPFWGLQFDEFLQAKKNTISLDSFSSWMLSRNREFNSESTNELQNITKLGWKKIRPDFLGLDEEFCDFIDWLEKENKLDKAQIKSHLQNIINK